MEKIDSFESTKKINSCFELHESRIYPTEYDEYLWIE